MLELIARHDLLLVFANVLAEQIGLPIPAFPTLIVAGALAADGMLSVPGVLALSVLAGTLGNIGWYVAGRVYGRRVTRLLCVIALSPDSCVRQMEMSFLRWGNLALIAANFVPGLSTVARPLAGATGVSWTRFLILNSIGVLVWAGVALALGAVFHDQVTDLLDGLARYGATSLQIVGGLFAAYLGWKIWQRHAFFRKLRVARIDVSELHDLMRQEPPPLVVDIRSPLARAEERRTIPGARVLELADVGTRKLSVPEDREIVFFCTCPNEASAAQAAMHLMKLGYGRVRPLRGGLDAWVEAGFALGEAAPDESPASLDLVEAT